MANASALWKAVLGDEDNEVIKSGTLAVTRGTGVLAAAAVALTNLDWIPGGSLSDEHKLWASIAVVGIWVILASSDAIARAKVTAAEKLAEASASPQTHVLASPLDAEIKELSRDEERGWKVMMMRTFPLKPTQLEYFVVKGDVGEWRDAESVKLV